MTIPSLHPVKSSNIAAVGYESGALFVKFNNGHVWKYDGVAADVHTAMMGAPSIGSFLHKNIKNRYPAQKVEGQ